MPHFPKPWFRESRGIWMVQIGGVQHNLGADQEQAFQRYHDLTRQPVAKKQVASESVVGIIDKYLEWSRKSATIDPIQW